MGRRLLRFRFATRPDRIGTSFERKVQPRRERCPVPVRMRLLAGGGLLDFAGSVRAVEKTKTLPGRNREGLIVQSREPSRRNGELFPEVKIDSAVGVSLPSRRNRKVLYVCSRGR